jgi:hypothetical protein
VDEESFIDNILKQIVEKYIRRFYSGEEHKLTIHMDSAGRHVCSETTVWIKSRGVKFFSGAGMDEEHSRFVFNESGNKLDF